MLNCSPYFRGFSKPLTGTDAAFSFQKNENGDTDFHIKYGTSLLVGYTWSVKCSLTKEDNAPEKVTIKLR